MEKAKTNGKRGGQPGNRNAVKHGRYSAMMLSRSEKEAEFYRSGKLSLFFLKSIK